MAAVSEADTSEGGPSQLKLNPLAGREMTTETFLDDWSRRYGNVPPVGYLLRPRFESVWLRMHSLPESKRYAETAVEWLELLRRHREVAETVLGSGPIVLIAAFYGEEIDESVTNELVPGTALNLQRLDRLTRSPDEECESVITVFGLETTLDNLPFEKLVRAVADDAISPVSLVRSDNLRVYAPYDGGADLFLETPALRDELKIRWNAWLSHRDDGL
jgi:hypothetical protein